MLLAIVNILVYNCFIEKGVWKLKINEKFAFKTVEGHTFIIDSQNDKNYGEVDFNEIKHFLWELAKNNDVTKTQMLDAALGRFDISTVLALGEIDGFIKKLKEYGII